MQLGGVKGPVLTSSTWANSWVAVLPSVVVEGVPRPAKTTVPNRWASPNMAAPPWLG